MIQLLVHSQDATLLFRLQPALGNDFQLAVESSREKVKNLLLQGKFDLLILDWSEEDAKKRMEYFDAVRMSQVPVAIMTDENGRKTAMELIERGVSNYFRKPAALSELNVAIRRVYEQRSVGQDPKPNGDRAVLAETGCDQMIGSSAGLQHVYHLIHRVAKLDASILITGESGTGKELIARALHNLSDRKKFGFVAVSCGAIPETLIEAELFGYEKGAFTGANGGRRGFLETAGNGTLLLDEIGELSLHTQVSLLRVVQERQFCRLGSSAMIPLQARLLFATHRNLVRMVAAGEFRQDLYYRINVVGIKAPALRHHAQDIPVLARYLLAKYAGIYRKPVAVIAPSALKLLADYSWPGNVRELENVIQKAIILTDDDTVRPEHFPDDLQQQDLPGVNPSQPATSFEDQLHVYKIKIARKAIEECNGNKTLAARSLQISRTYLHRLIKEPLAEECCEISQPGRGDLPASMETAAA